jgi:hypothetical protein
MTIHDQGAKAERDRRKVVLKYLELCQYLKLRPMGDDRIAKLKSSELYRFCEDTYNKAPASAKRFYAQAIGAVPRSNPRAYRWFRHDLLHLTHAQGAKRSWLSITAPLRYPGYLRRAKGADRARVENQKARGAGGLGGDGRGNAGKGNPEHRAGYGPAKAAQGYAGDAQ